MKRLLELANKIEDLELREKVIDFLKNPKLSNPDFKKYPKEDITKVKTPFTIANVGTVERDLLNHTDAVTDLCIKTAETIEKCYGIKINKDYLIAGALLHDIMKMFEWRVDGRGGITHSGILLDHSMLGLAEFYHRNFPEGILHVVISHFGEASPTPPRNYEALILHYVDTLLSLTEFHLYGVKQEKPMQLLVLDEEMIKKIREESEKKD